LDVSIFLARLIGPLYLAVGLGLFLNQSHYREMLRSLPAGGLFYYLSGAVALSFGLVILQFHNLWVADWRVIFTVIGWIALAKGALLLLAPKAAVRVTLLFASGPVLLGAAAFAILLGGWLSYLGYLA